MRTTQAERDEAKRLPDLRKQAGPGTRIWMDGNFEANAADDVDKLLGLLRRFGYPECGCHPVCRCAEPEAQRIRLKEIQSECRTILAEQEGK